MQFSLVLAVALLLGTIYAYKGGGWAKKVQVGTPTSVSAQRPVRSQRLYSTPQKPFKNFDDMLSKLDCPVLVDFYAQWCGPCKMMQPVLEDIAGRMEDKIKVAKVDTDRSPKLGAKYQVEALPTLILFDKGQVVERYIGYMTADELEYAVQGTLNRLANAPPV